MKKVTEFREIPRNFTELYNTEFGGMIPLTTRLFSHWSIHLKGRLKNKNTYRCELVFKNCSADFLFQLETSKLCRTSQNSTSSKIGKNYKDQVIKNGNK
jgi:hypothetical protein